MMRRTADNATQCAPFSCGNEKCKGLHGEMKDQGKGDLILIVAYLEEVDVEGTTTGAAPAPHCAARFSIALVCVAVFAALV